MNGAGPAELEYFAGEFLAARDYHDEQAYRMLMQRRGAASLNTWGIAHGLDATATPNGDGFTVAPGLAIDCEGRLVVQDESRTIALPANAKSPQVLVISYSETRRGTPGPTPVYIEEGSTLVWLAPSDPAFVAGETIALGTYTSGGTPPFDPSGRRYAGAPAGTLQFSHPLARTPPVVVGWSTVLPGSTASDPSPTPRVGLRFTAPLTTLATGSPALAAKSLLSVARRLGVGTMSPTATLDVVGANGAQDGPGLLTSSDRLVRGTDQLLDQVVPVGATVMVIDRQGEHRQSRVVDVMTDGGLFTETALNCADAPFQFEQPLLVSICASASEPAVLSVDTSAQVGFGVDFPKSRLHVAAGDLELSAATGIKSCDIRFAGDGKITNHDDKAAVSTPLSELAFVTGKSPQLAIRQDGDIKFLTGQGDATPPVGTILMADGNVGIGTMAPAAMLDVIGCIQSEQGGFIFPDGTVQTTAAVSVPIGTVLDCFIAGSVFQLPPNYRICDGSAVNDDADKGTPFYGHQLPNLADLFVVGVAAGANAGTTSGNDTHTHTYTVPTHTHAFPHTHPPVSGTTGPANESAGMAGAPNNNAQEEHEHNFVANVEPHDPMVTGANSDAGQGATTDPASLLPPYVNLLKIIRIK